MAENEGNLNEEKMMRVTWDEGEFAQFNYANHIYVSHGGGKEFHIYFGHLSPPITQGKTPDEIPESLEIKTISKIVVSPEVMREFVEVLNKNLDKFEKGLQKEEDK